MFQWKTDLSEILRVCREWHKLPVIQFWGWFGRNSGFWITLKFSLPLLSMGHKGNRYKTEDGAATWRTTLPWQRCVGSDCFLVHSFVHSLIRSLTHSFINSFTYSCIRYSFGHLFTHSFIFSHSFNRSFIYLSFIDWFVAFVTLCRWSTSMRCSLIWVWALVGWYRWARQHVAMTSPYSTACHYPDKCSPLYSYPPSLRWTQPGHTSRCGYNELPATVLIAVE